MTVRELAVLEEALLHRAGRRVGTQPPASPLCPANWVAGFDQNRSVAEPRFIDCLSLVSCIGARRSGRRDVEPWPACSGRLLLEPGPRRPRLRRRGSDARRLGPFARGACSLRLTSCWAKAACKTRRISRESRRIDQKTKLEDLVLVCSNCQRMIHRKRPWLDAASVRTLVANVFNDGYLTQLTLCCCPGDYDRLR